MTELVIVRAEDDAALVAEAKRLVGFLDRVPDVPLVDVAYTCALRRGACALAGAVVGLWIAGGFALAAEAVYRRICSQRCPSEETVDM